jgi:NitT/TauT family transport system ATP-binding protein
MIVPEPFISLRNVRKIYRSGNEEFLAVSDVSMDVQEGELVSLVGPSGCGKTTVLKILAGLHRADGGSVRIGSTQTLFNPARDIGMVFQQALLLKWRTILDNVLLPAEIVGLPMKAARIRARDLLNLVGLSGYEDKYPQQLSGGMQQRTVRRAGRIDARTDESGDAEDLARERQNHRLRYALDPGGGVPRLALCRFTAAPARTAEFFPIELPFPRVLPIKTTAEFGAYARRIYETLGLGTSS